jgi:hypothetical protein
MLKHNADARPEAIQFPAHAQGLKAEFTAPWRDEAPDDHPNGRMVCPASRASLLDDGHGRASGNAVAVEPSLRNIEQEGFSRGDPPLHPVLLDRDDLTEHGIVRRPVVPSFGTAFRIAAPALLEALGGRRFAVACFSHLAHS